MKEEANIPPGCILNPFERQSSSAEELKRGYTTAGGMVS
jgi:hypothetical protein